MKGIVDVFDEEYEFASGMSAWESARIAWRGLTSNKMRTGLTMLGIVIGVAAVIAMVSMGQGAAGAVAAKINSLGTNLLMVMPGNDRLRMGPPGAGGAGATTTLTLEDAKVIQEHLRETIAGAAPQVRGSIQVKMGNQEANTQATGTTPAYETVNNAPLRAGRYFTEEEVKGRAKLAILGQTVIDNLTGDKTLNPVGETITVNKVPFTIIGVLNPKGSDGFQDQDDTLLIPVTTALRRVFNQKNINMLSVEAATAKDMDLATEQIQGMLRQRHHLLPPFPQDDDFSIHSQASIMQTMQSVTGTLTALLAGVALVSLVVGGIGVMNIMLVSVTERTREIGLRKAVGATSGDILMQFLIEALVMALMGGGVGILVGVGFSTWVAIALGWQPSVQPGVILLACLVSGGIGVVFGLYPAAKAARQSPIEALRYE